MSAQLIIPKGHNLSVYFLLPLLGLNKNSFPEFLNSFLSYNGKVLIELSKQTDFEYWKHPQYVTDFNFDNKHYVVYMMPEEYTEVVSLFLEGKYSRFSDEVKLIIYKGSGLKVNEAQPNGKVLTHNLLLALDQNPTLRALMEEELNVEIDPSDELLPKLDLDKEIMDIDTDIHCNTI